MSAATAEQPTAQLAGGGRVLHPARAPRAPRTMRAGSVSAATLAVAGVLCFATFEAGGGLSLAPMTTTELVLTLASGAIVAAAALLAPRGARAYGTWPLGLLLAFTMLTAISVGWSVTPDSSWQDTGRMLAYSGVFAAAVALVRVAPGYWRALLGGIVLWAVAVCGYALLTKVFPAQLDAGEVYARLQQPYGYWNAVGLTAGMGTIASLWLGGRRSGHGLLSASAYPITGLLLVALMFAYSRWALATLAVGIVVWMAIVPLRLRAARVLIVGALGAAPVVAWTFSKHALSSDGVALHERAAAGHQLGVLLAAMLLALAVAGVAIGFQSARQPPSALVRRRAGALLIALVVLALCGVAGGLAVSKRGFTGTISHDLRSLVDPNAPLPANTPNRLTAIGSVRARYWKEALEAFASHPALGVGASGYEIARLRYRAEPQEEVRHAHGYLVQTLSDLGIVGFALTLALLAAWLACALRATLPLNHRLALAARKPPGDTPDNGPAGGPAGKSDKGPAGGPATPVNGPADGPAAKPVSVQGVRAALPRGIGVERVRAPYTPERIGLLAMLCVVCVFGVHSFADWTWYVPGTACVGLLCAGWLAGRGPLRTGAANEAGETGAASPDGIEDTFVLWPGGQSGRERFLASPRRWRNPLSTWRTGAEAGRRSLPSAGAAAVAVAAVALALLAAWTEWQPQRSTQSSEEALALLSRNPSAALAAARTAVSRDPLSAQALFTLAAVQRADGQVAQGRLTLQKAVHGHPADPQAWLELGMYDLRAQPRAALSELRAAVYLNPQSIPIQNAYVEALRVVPPAAQKTVRVGSPRRRARARSA